MARAEVNFDMEDYERAREDVKWVLGQEASHADARILEGKIQLKTHFLGKAIDDEWGAEIRNHEIQFGDPLVVNFYDPILESNHGIELTVASGLGDQEDLMLHPVDSKHGRYRGALPTSTGKPVAGDRQLQTQVGDSITVEYMPRADIPAHRIEVQVVESK